MAIDNENFDDVEEFSATGTISADAEVAIIKTSVGGRFAVNLPLGSTFESLQITIVNDSNVPCELLPSGTDIIIGGYTKIVMPKGTLKMFITQYGQASATWDFG